MFNTTVGNLDAVIIQRGADISLGVFVVIDAVAIVANLTLIKALRSRRRSLRSVTRLYMTCVSVANLGVAVFTIPFTIITLGTRKWIFGAAVCYISASLMAFWFTLTIFTMTLLSLHNYRTITRPMILAHGRKSAFRSLVVTIIASVLISVLPIGIDGVAFDDNIAQCTAVSKDKRKVFAPVTFFLCCYVFPTCINAFTYYRAIKSLSTGALWVRSNSTSNERTIASKKYVTRTLCIAFAGYMFCWTPYFVLFVVYMVVSPYHPATKHMHRIASSTAYLGSALNPVIYIIRNRLHDRLYRVSSKLSRRFSSVLRRTSSYKSEKVDSLEMSLLRGPAGGLMKRSSDDRSWIAEYYQPSPTLSSNIVRMDTIEDATPV